MLPSAYTLLLYPLYRQKGDKSTLVRDPKPTPAWVCANNAASPSQETVSLNNPLPGSELADCSTQKVNLRFNNGLDLCSSTLVSGSRRYLMVQLHRNRHVAPLQTDFTANDVCPGPDQTAKELTVVLQRPLRWTVIPLQTPLSPYSGCIWPQESQVLRLTPSDITVSMVAIQRPQ